MMTPHEPPMNPEINLYASSSPCWSVSAKMMMMMMMMMMLLLLWLMMMMTCWRRQAMIIEWHDTQTNPSKFQSLDDN